MKSKNILIFIQWKSNIERNYILKSFVSEFRNITNHNFYIISAYYDPELDKLKNENVTIDYINLHNLRFLKKINRIGSYIKKYSIDIIICFDILSSFISYICKFFKTNIKIIWLRYEQYFSNYMKYNKKIKSYILIYLEKILSIKTDKIITSSESILLQYNNFNFKKKLITSIPFSINTEIDTDKKEIAVIRKNCLTHRKNKIVTLAAPFSRLKKGFDIYIKVINEFLDNYKLQHSFNFCVFGCQGEHLNYYLHQKNITGSIKIIENYYSLTNVIKASDIIVIPSRYDGNGLTALLSAQLNKIVIASNIHPYSEIISDSMFLFNPNSYSSLLNKLTEIHSNYNQYYSAAKKLNIPEKYDLNNNLKFLNNIIISL